VTACACFRVFDPLDFIAEVTQHIPNASQHHIRYYGWIPSRPAACAKLRCDPDPDYQPAPEEP